jgi:hypothetical protein
MQFPYRPQWLLRRMSRDLRRSDPHLTAMLAIFARLTAGEAITGEEQSTSPGARAWRGLTWLGRASVHLAAALIARAGRILRRAAGGCAAARRRLGTVARTVPGLSSFAHPPLRRSGPGLPAN